MTRRAFITGGGGGLGVAVGERFLTAGWTVAAPRRAEAELTDPEAVRRAVAAAAPLHAVVNLAGGFAPGHPPAAPPPPSPSPTRPCTSSRRASRSTSGPPTS